MNILYLSHRIPYPPDKGDKIRSFHQIQYLSREHTVHLACLVDDKADLEHVRTLRRYCASVAAVYRNRGVARIRAALACVTSPPLSVASFYSRELQAQINDKLISERFDRIVVFSSAMARYVEHVGDIPKVMDFVDVDSEKWRIYSRSHPFPASWIYRLEADRLARYEERIAREFDHSIFSTAREAELFRQQVTGGVLSVIPNGVDLDYFTPSGDDSPSPYVPVIVFTGTMDYFPNVDAVRFFCEEIFPLVRESVPAVQFHIVGRNPTREVRGLGRHRNVILTGSVPDIRPYLAAATLAVAPLRIARGVQNKVLEAMAMALPVVGTPPAFQGIPATDADGIRVAEDPEGFAHQVLALLEDPGLRRHCAGRARAYVERHHRWQDHGACLVSVLQGTRAEHRDPAGRDRDSEGSPTGAFDSAMSLRDR